MAEKQMKSGINPWKIAFWLVLVAAIWLGIGLTSEQATSNMLRDADLRTNSALQTLAAVTPELLHNPQADAYATVLFYLQKSTPLPSFTTTGTTIEMDCLRFIFNPQGALQKIEITDTYGTGPADLPKDRDAIFTPKRPADSTKP